MKKIGILFGQERSFPYALIERINSKNVEGIQAEPVQIDKVVQAANSGYAVIIDRISQDVPFYRALLKNAASSGTAVINNPFWWSADDKFFNNALSEKIGVPVPKTVLLPSKEHPADTSAESFSNLSFPLDWESMFEYVGFPAFMKPFAGGGWKNVYKLENAEDFFRSYNETGQLVMMLQEAIDFCRYYAAQGRKDFKEQGIKMPGPTGEENIYTRHGKGVFVCISPWNFPIAIYTGQIAAALMAGNSVIAKPAEQTSLIGYFIARFFYKAGLPDNVLTFMPGDGRIGAALVEHDDVAGVVFTGSTETAHFINRTLAESGGPITRLIAETGGQNAMIADSSALTEQVVDDVLHSAFGSAGQRCSACRLLYVQEDVADKTILMLQGAMQTLKVGDPLEFDTDVGPLIDEEALMHVQAHKTRLEGFGRKIAEAPLDPALKTQGHYFAPLAVEIYNLDHLRSEVFGPILHVIRYKPQEIDRVIDEINAQGYALTFRIHSRVQSFIDHVTSRIQAGNIYVNRGMTGAVVGVQPFGGHRLSGTGPKAGGPEYLRAFATERVVSTDITAAGGNTSLVMLPE